MNRWNELITEPRADALRALLCEAATVAHAENGERFAPDDLGDDGRIYGICTSNTARFLAARAVEDGDLDGVTVCERGMVWWLEIERDGAAVRVYFYKAPPGASAVWDLRLDDAEVKKELSTSNGRQIELFNRGGGQGSVDLLNLIVVHYGDPLKGLQKLDVGAPYITPDGIAWGWYERLDNVEVNATTSAPTTTAPLGDDGAGYIGLRLVESPAPDRRADVDEIPEHKPGDVAQEPATAAFEGLGLRDESRRDDDENTGRGEEPS